MFELLLFAADPQIIREAALGGISSIVVDWENQDKYERQRNYDTQINNDSIDDLLRVRETFTGNVICRVNGYRDDVDWFGEVDLAIGHGADEILLPMVRTPEEVEAALQHVSGRCGVSIMLETEEAVSNARTLSSLPLCRTYIGLNDLAIDRGSCNIFEAVVDGTLDEIRGYFSVPFGFAGLTLPELGSPILCSLLMGEMARLKCSMAVLRRSFLRDTRHGTRAQAIKRILVAVDRAFRMSGEELEENHVRLMESVKAFKAG
jgi:hypothetical protein